MAKGLPIQSALTFHNTRMFNEHTREWAASLPDSRERYDILDKIENIKEQLQLLEDRLLESIKEKP